jgi:hypothetical protein
MVLRIASVVFFVSALVSAQGLGPPCLLPAPEGDRILAREAPRPGVVASRSVRTDPEVLRSLAEPRAVAATTPFCFGDDMNHVATWIGVERCAGRTVLSGRLDAAGRATLVFADDGVAAGRFELGDELWLLEWLGAAGLHVLRRLDPARLPEPASDDAIAVAHRIGTPLPGALQATLGPTIVDVLVVYTAAARAGAGGTAQIRNTIALSLASANQGLVDSGVELQFRLVHAAETSYVEAGNQTDLTRLRIPGDGHLDEVHALRANYGADLVQLVAEAGFFACGVGYQMIAVTPSFRDWAFSVVSRSCIPNGYSMQHEWGHNLGSEHDVGNALGPGAFPYSYGFRTADSQYRTIMAYSPGTRVNLWSSPNVVHRGYVMGSATKDNARSLGGTKATAREFTPTKLLEWEAIAGGIAGQNGEPRLVGAGTINSLEPMSLTLSAMRDGAPGVLAIGARGPGLPLFGGTLVVEPFITLSLTGTTGPLVIDLAALASLPAGSAVVFQAWFLDAAAPEGLSASDGLATLVP